MTAEARRIAQIAYNQHKHDSNSEQRIASINLIAKEIESYANTRTRKVARKAVVEVFEEYETVRHVNPVIFAGRIINRIKTKIGDNLGYLAGM